MMWAIILALAAWGLLLAIGAYLGLWQPDGQVARRDVRRFWIVFGVVAAFLAFWGAAILFRTARAAARHTDRRQIEE